MTATAHPTPPPGRSTGRTLAFLVPAGVAVLVGLVFLVAGGAGIYAHGERDGRGYVTSDDHGLSTQTAAIVSDDLDVDLDGGELVTTPDGLGRMSVEAHAKDDRPVFVGIARTADVDRLLGGVAHTTVTDVDFDPFEASYRDSRGDARAKPPGDSTIWAASAQGQGAQRMTWDARDGDWSVVVMNADGTRGVDVDVSAGIKVPGWVAIAGWSAAGSGIVLLLGAAALIAAGFRRTGRG